METILLLNVSNDKQIILNTKEIHSITTNYKNDIMKSCVIQVVNPETKKLETYRGKTFDLADIKDIITPFGNNHERNKIGF